MARQDSIIKLTGNIGDLTFFKTKDGYGARKKGGISSERFKTDPAFERVRENAQEFGKAGSSSKLLRTALRPLIMKSADGKMTGRLTKQFMRVIQADSVNTRGKRNVIDGEAELLRGFEFNEGSQLFGTFFAPFTPSIDRATGRLTIAIPEFIPSQMIARPEGSTHFRLLTSAVEMDFENGKYVVKNSESEPLVLGPAPIPALEIVNEVTPASPHPLFLVFGIEFYQFVNGAQYPLKNGAFNSMAIVEVSGTP